MSKVFFDVGLSLDGFLAGPDRRPDNPMGGVALAIHDWMFRTAAFREHLHLGDGGERSQDDERVRGVFARIGTTIIGRRMFDEGEACWPEEAPFRTPVFVLTNHAREPWRRKGGTTFFFVTGGFDEALARAREAAGGKDVRIGGGADTIRQALRCGVVDEFSLHVAPVLLGGGLRLFEDLAGPFAYEPVATGHSPYVTHVQFRRRQDRGAGAT